MELRVDLTGIDSDGQAIRSTAHAMPDPDVGPVADCGSNTVSEALQGVIAQVNDNLLGAAAEMFRLGGVLSDAAQVVADTDSQLGRL